MRGSAIESPGDPAAGRLHAADEAAVIDSLFQHLLEHVSDAVIVVRVDVDPARVVAASAAHERLVRRQVVGKPIGEGDPSPRREFLQHTVQRAAEYGSLRTSGAWVEPDGVELRMGTTMTAIDIDGGRYVVAYAYDADGTVAMGSDTMVLETLLASAAIERRRVAQDLHDDTVQVLSALTVELELLRRRDGEHAAQLGVLRDHLQAANERIRNMIADLDPANSAGADFGAALRERLAAAAQQAGVTLVITDRLGKPLPEQAAGALYWIATEAVFNALRHANCDRVEVSLEPAADGVHLFVRDCGTGFDPSQPARPGHYGLVSMRARAQRLGGSVAVTSSAVRGTKISVWIPIASAGPADRGPDGGWNGVGGAPPAATPAEMDEMVTAIRQVDADVQLAWVTAPLGIVLCDSAGAVVRANPAAARLLGTDGERLPGRPASSFMIDVARPSFGDALDDVRAGRREQRVLETVLRSEDGAARPVRCHVQAVARLGGPPWSLLITLDASGGVG